MINLFRLSGRLLVALSLVLPAAAYALGLGDIKVGSALNQPLSADIELVGATADELAQLRAGVASGETFARYGVDRPIYLSSFTFKVAKDSAGRNVLQVRSQEALTEPFLTFLVEVNWPRGRLIREYTVLLDPPVFDEKATPAAPVAAPTTGETASSAAGVVKRPTPPAEAPPAPEPTPTASKPAPSASAPFEGSEYRVVSGDTLSSIARRTGATGKADINRVMIATFRANPSAFTGNINRLSRGAVLRIPGSSELEGLSASEAASEVRRQMSEWRGAAAGAGGGGGEQARLRLVTPSEPITGSPSAPAPAAPGEGKPAPTAAEQKAEAARRLLELKNEELARAQAQKPVAPAPAPTPAVTPAPAPSPAAATPTTPDATVTPPAVEPAPATPPVAIRPAKPPVVKPAPAPEPGFLDAITDNLLYVGVAGAALLLLGLFGFKQLQRRRETQVDDALRTLDREPMPAETGAIPGLSNTARIPREEVDRQNFVVEESDDDSGEFQAPPVRAAAPRAEIPTVRALEDTMSSDTAMNLEQADPLAEADFHMAYGLYDQAADIVKLAIERDPKRRDLKLKLLEVYFVWGNKEAFIDVARELGRTRDTAPQGEWDKVAIMGRQIAPDDPLFAGAPGRSTATDVDLDLEASGGGGVDLELLGDSEGGAGGAGDEMDLDLGQALASDSLADTGESFALDSDALDFPLDDTRSGGTTRELAPRLDSPTVEQPALRGNDATRELPARGGDSPTVEQPGLPRGYGESPTVESPALAATAVRDRIDTALAGRSANEATQELSLDDLGFDVDSLSSTSNSIEVLSATDHPSDAPTMVAGMDDRSRQMLRDAETRRVERLDPDRTSETPRLDVDDATQLAPHADATSRMPLDPEATGTARVLGAGDLDLDLDQLAKALESDTIEQPRRDEVAFSTDVFATGLHKLGNGAAKGGVDLDLGLPGRVDHENTVTERINTDDLALPELEPVTLSEVGTKLDLARAYMDMGDPDGARSILSEVLSEGSASQKQEAQRLIETLPG